MSQPVYFGVTQSGQQGLFTRGILAWPLDDRGVYNFHADPQGFCAKLGFTYTPREVR